MGNINMLDLPVASGIAGAEYIWIVQGGTDRRTQISDVASAASFILPTTTITSGTTYNVLSSDVLIIVSVGSPVTINLQLATARATYLYVKDGSGNASTNNITITGDTMDGLASVVINTDYGILQIAPNPLGGYAILDFG